ncbi:MAG: hypothetical protein M3R25_00140 [Bacteroidota bacterium]|nr:hypothetical protein [Bacteroidota bacterium]
MIHPDESAKTISVLGILRFLRIGSLCCGIIITSFACKQNPSIIPEIDQKTFSKYWLQGKAEISSYHLQQAFNEKVYEGKVTLLYMVEDFSLAKQVELKNPEMYKNDLVRVMKLISSKHFITGVSDNQLMTSIFTPLDYQIHPHSLKLTGGIQDWSGQSFFQSNFKGNRYEVRQFSNLADVGDKDYTLVSTMLEDEIWTRIRVAPNTLPIGEIKITPSADYLLLMHGENKVYSPTAVLTIVNGDYVYTIIYQEVKRELEIRFEQRFPYKIVGWKETKGKNEVTTAELTNATLNDFWNYNQPKDSTLRIQLLPK